MQTILNLPANYPRVTIITVGVIILLIILLLGGYGISREYLGEPVYLDMMSMENSNPPLFHYTGREKDVAGMSGRDYYLENLAYANERAAPQLLKGDAAFIDQTDYLDMPAKYRPLRAKSSSAAQVNAEANGNKQERLSNIDILNSGAY